MSDRRKAALIPYVIMAVVVAWMAYQLWKVCHL